MAAIPELRYHDGDNWLDHTNWGEGFTGGGASAVCTQNIYHFTESSIQNAKKFLAQKSIEVRL